MSELTKDHCIGPYRIVRLIGEGGMGSVYEARQEPLDRRVALKTLHSQFASDQDAIARFFNEAKALSRLEHPSIVQVSDFGNAADGTAYLVMEYLRGQSLGRRLRTGDGRLPVVVALQLAWQVADVLAIAHAQGVVHRDLKPDNLMLVEDPVAPGGERVKVLDFGIAKLTHAADRNGVKTDTLAVMGTPMYMSPEQCTGAGGVDAKTDVYSLGCVLYQALAGRPPFMADGPGQLIGMHLFQEPKRLSAAAPAVPTSVAALVHRLLIKDKSQRPSMPEAADELGRLLSKLSGAGPVFRSRRASDPAATLVSIVGAQPATTLGQSMGQRSKLGKQQRRFVMAGLWGVVLIVALVIAWRSRISMHTPVSAAQLNPPVLVAKTAPSLPPDPVVLPPPAPKLVHWVVETRPPSATILDETGRKIGTTPWSQESAAESGTTTLRLRRDGYGEATVQLGRTADTVLVVRLKRIQAMRRPKPAPEPRPSSPVPPLASPPAASNQLRLPHET